MKMRHGTTLPPLLMEGPPMPARHNKLPALLSPAAGLESAHRPALPPLSSLTTGLDPTPSVHGGNSNGNSNSSGSLPPNASTIGPPPGTAPTSSPPPPHVPLTPSHSGGRDYFPPVPGTAGQPSPAAGTAGPNATMVMILTFMDLRVVRVSDESLSMLGHHPMLFANKSLSELLHRTDRPKLAVLREWLRWVVCSASGLSDVHLTRFPGNVTSPVFQRAPTELTVPAPDWPAHIIVEDHVHFRVLDGEYRQFRIRLYVAGPGVRVGQAETWEKACVVCEVRRHATPTVDGASEGRPIMLAEETPSAGTYQQPAASTAAFATYDNASSAAGPPHDR
ncbi:hypothetical protein SYNPS1DRAFT_26726 [Syncephalis pseudoplumigaleata]|uniref:PAS domain-containing protein n=1 Tax=Syncephalis pseudoplumigaleata TaxID=1712513 RepID=A0A4P9Z5B2_9FUNG|nr:hypothetical protein SYNPS1DRAFT_26726 [Syncephalis pseudoplumigaleata]|eukprot:RKP27638.1 hypothetical protein SYNPS1DRAFT_26726 [Syncephalis pseudoplumigaleata]